MEFPACEDVVMDPTPGRLLLATPQMLEPTFHRTVILMLEHNMVGSLGVVLNRPTEVRIADALPGWATAVGEPEVLFAGGPVEPAGILGIGRGLDGEISPADLDRGPSAVGPVRLFQGYAGWGHGQLDYELTEDAWWVVDSNPEDLFAEDPSELWYQVLGRLPDDRSMLRHMPDDPSLN